MRYGKLNPEFKAKWIAALRSGEFEQGTKYLRTNGDRFCCLGVAAHLLAPDEWEDSYPAWLIRGSECALPTALCVEVGLNRNAHDALWKMNDGCYSFSEIADWIERHL